ncbi:hypothetical protein H8356DRAFT_1747511 [Neocallimastix lanati (nom. inval.)]|jgi:GNAT superfamily N-acetyltransferase|uniref:N-acetyltransferase domain-containing protein n=1 Tax=Neocallimastix californiae TaxID=1754190 RepID=A0A1Y2A5T9_9FUNG|nr:hypothetical protein H8356DRAFT_1747511 [Neocallimastix sp. JGI-2020a]ORY17889.1 hypothetical protein LY90DRAFT_677275 [Neocallimastix californiae]|eukprot:ORY17889.1 hypothetical protein LY90DRAFT_677275 [Neocallimastix californiae]
MQLKEVLDNKEEEERIKNLYEEAFPEEERAPFQILKRKIKQKRAEQWNFYEEDTWVGWIYLVKHKDIAYIFYFAIDAKLRGQGYGTKALKAFIEKYKDYRVFLGLEDWKEEEAENHEQRVKRHQFYKNCGLEELPHKLKEVGNIYSIMGVGGAVEPQEYKDLINAYMGWPYKYFLDMRMID